MPDRRQFLKGGLALASAFIAPSLVSCTSRSTPLVGFTPVAPGLGPMPEISPDYEFSVMIPWGTPLQASGPVFSYPPAAADQAQQVGIGHDGMSYFPFPEEEQTGLLAINHEYGRNQHVLGKPVAETLAEVRAAQHALGMSVVKVGERAGRWQLLDSPFNRRLHVNSPMQFAGPAAGSRWLENPAGNPVLGTYANCSNGETPWGTYLTCEENFNLYFGATGQFEPDEAMNRYLFLQHGIGYGWHHHDGRFDLSNPAYVNEKNRFGWVVEVDPFEPDSIPVKRTALGRFKHEGAATVVGRDGRAVVYMGDDSRFEFIYKFVSEGNWQEMRAAGRHPLDHGRLYAARFDEGGRGAWLPLSLDNPALSERFTSEAEILVFARLAASLAGATPMDRPEWTTVAPNGDVFCSLTENKHRTTPNAANPQAPNPHGHIIRWHDDGDHVGLGFRWDIFLLASETHGTGAEHAGPDGLMADADGRLFIQTDADQPGGANNQLLVADSLTGDIRRLLTGVPGCEITGLATTPDRRTLFVNIQHPGNGDPQLTNFPAAPDNRTVPRDCTLVIRRRDGGVVGS